MEDEDEPSRNRNGIQARWLATVVAKTLLAISFPVSTGRRAEMVLGCVGSAS